MDTGARRGEAPGLPLGVRGWEALSQDSGPPGALGKEGGFLGCPWRGGKCKNFAGQGEKWAPGFSQVLSSFNHICAWR